MPLIQDIDQQIEPVSERRVVRNGYEGNEQETHGRDEGAWQSRLDALSLGTARSNAVCLLANRFHLSLPERQEERRPSVACTGPARHRTAPLPIALRPSP